MNCCREPDKPWPIAAVTHRVPELVGYSGAELTLRERDGMPVVRKTARLASSSDRLRLQCEKLRWSHGSGIPCPEVFAEGSSGGRYWFEMEYVAGESLAHKIIYGSDVDWCQVVDRLVWLLGRYREQAGEVIPREKFLRKLGDVTRCCTGNPVTRPFVRRIAQFAEDLAVLDWSSTCASACHGDLTFENILIRHDGAVILIDFDVPAQSSWALDVGKLYQDIYGQWFLRHLAVARKDRSKLVNAQNSLSHVEMIFGQKCRGLSIGAHRLYQYAALHLMRTLPYAEDVRFVKYVLARISLILEHCSQFVEAG